jgi:outer membrane autotransporter protein
LNAGNLQFQILGATANGSLIQNSGGSNIPTFADFTLNGTVQTGGPSDNNTINSLIFQSGSSLRIFNTLTVTSGNLSVTGGRATIEGDTLFTPGDFNKSGPGSLFVWSDLLVGGDAYIHSGLLSINHSMSVNNLFVLPGSILGGVGFIQGNISNQGTVSPGNSIGTLTIAGDYTQTSAGVLNIEIESPSSFDRVVVGGQASLAGTLNVIPYGGNNLTYGQKCDFLQAGRIVGTFDTINAPEGFRGRFINTSTVGTLLIAPDTYTRVAVTPNQERVAKVLDAFILAKGDDREVVSTALDSLTSEEYPAAFDQIMPGFYESLANISIEQAFNQTQMLNQRISSVRLGAEGFQAMGGISQPLLYDKDGKSASEAKDASLIVESAMATNWNTWSLGNGQFSRSTDLSHLLNSNTDAGGFLVGADYRWSENFVSGLYAGYEYTYSKYGSDSNMRGNGVNFGGYASYATEDGYYADAVIGGGYTGYQTRRSIQFSTIDRTAQADPNSTQFSAALNLGKDFEIGKFTLGPIVGAQYTYAGIGSFTETGAESLDLSLAQQNANSLRSTLGGRIAYTWNLNQTIAIIPEVRMFWQHEFLNNARNINASLDGGNGVAFNFETTDPYRDSVFAGAGVTAQFGKNLSGSIFYNVNFGSQTYQSNMLSVGLNVSF